MRDLDDLDPQVVELAASVSIASTVDPALLRTARRRLHPELTHEVEAQVYHSPLAESRGRYGFALRAEYLPALRNRLIAEGRLTAAADIVREVHRPASELVRLEESLTYALLAGEPVAEILRSIIAWLRDAENRRPVCRWIVRVFRRAPERLWSDAASAEWAIPLIQTATVVLSGGAPGGGGATGQPLPVFEQRRMAVGVRFTTSGLELAGTPRGETVLQVPAAWPVVLTVDGNDARQVVILRDAADVVTSVVSLPVRLETVVGERLEVSPLRAVTQVTEAEPANHPAIVDDPTAPVFFLSYARPERPRPADAGHDPDRQLMRFFDDLTQDVNVLIGSPPGRDPGFLDLDRGGNSSWQGELLDAVGRCQVFVSLLSESYVRRSVWSAREWDAFSRRRVLKRVDGTTSPQTAIVPVLWAPLTDGLPRRVAEVNMFSPAEFPDESYAANYRENGMLGLAQGGDERAYRAGVWTLAKHISRLRSTYWVEPMVPSRLDDLRTSFE